MLDPRVVQNLKKGCWTILEWSMSVGTHSTAQRKENLAKCESEEHKGRASTWRKERGMVMQERFSPCRNKMWGCVSSKALANCGACDVHLYNTVGLMAVHSLCSLHLQTGLPSLSRPPPPWSALCLCPAPRRTSGRSSYVNWVSAAPVRRRRRRQVGVRCAQNF